ncbi:glycine/sarcosine/betaine reductase selenoprotein B family protein [Cytobacillus sp. S13-E01]|uniref:glycine/sarcosine/betaine reductase selenoprotein B family protein n=1 Tax=Cytobacillus sp. S13-E01 TaxID=3031326 RepID=UPI0023D832DF|nr:glycine/sarcosine/betaine reductase selenoprotein B family protein [Cytobacillus sp. S13-E01]MDF0726404.1 glycine/sarcosine/betaine reductase selenoprotein B family protein [Cytobacillus sp. S13-E01]
MMEISKPTQIRPGLWNTVNDRYPGSMITKHDYVPLAKLKKPLSESKLTFVSTAGVQPSGTMPFDTVHPIGDYTYRKVPSHLKPEDLEIHQLKYPTVGANEDLNVIFPIERLQELAEEGVIGSLSDHLFSFIGYNMDPDKLEETLAEDIAEAVVKDQADIALLSPA